MWSVDATETSLNLPLLYSDMNVQSRLPCAHKAQGWAPVHLSFFLEAVSSRYEKGAETLSVWRSSLTRTYLLQKSHARVTLTLAPSRRRLLTAGCSSTVISAAAVFLVKDMEDYMRGNASDVLTTADN